jgi:hypothetical protein
MNMFGTPDWSPLGDDMPESMFESAKGLIEACEKKRAWIAE